MRDNDKFKVKHQKSIHAYFTQIPNCVDDLDLDPIEFRIYFHLFRVAGVEGACWKSLNTLADHLKISKSRLKIGLKKLEAGDNKYNLKLIEKEERIKEDGSRNTSSFTILDIMDFNINLYRSGGGGSPENPHVGHQEAHREPLGSHKEEPVKEEPYKEQQHIERVKAPVVVFSEEEEQEIAKTAIEHGVAITRVNHLKAEAKNRDEFMESVKAFQRYAKKSGKLDNSTATFTSAITAKWKFKVSKEDKEQAKEIDARAIIEKTREEATKLIQEHKADPEEVKIKDNYVEIKQGQGFVTLGFLETDCLAALRWFFAKKCT